MCRVGCGGGGHEFVMLVVIVNPKPVKGCYISTGSEAPRPVKECGVIRTTVHRCGFSPSPIPARCHILTCFFPHIMKAESTGEYSDVSLIAQMNALRESMGCKMMR